MDSEMNNNFSFDLPKNKSNVIKVIGVGGGGSNAINHMFQKGINGVDFVISNTDAQALNESPVPIKIQLGATLTEGLGAGANPDVGAMAAQESFDEIKKLEPGQGGEIHITDAIRNLILKGNNFFGNIFKGKYLDCGTINGYIQSGIQIFKGK